MIYSLIKRIVRKLFRFLLYCRKKYLLRGSIVVCEKGSSFHVGKSVRVSRCRIHIHRGTQLTIGDHTCIKNTHIDIQSTGKEGPSSIGSHCLISNTCIIVNGSLKMGNGNIIERGYHYRSVHITINGNLIIGDKNRLRCTIWSRYHSSLQIGNYNNINEESELRCDERIMIGDFNQISYRCSIWDTNTHNIYKATERRELTISKYPIYGYEYEKPKTKPVIIGNDNWIGKNASILKGSSIGNKCIIGYGTLLSNVQIADNHTVVLSNNLKIFENRI